MPLNSPIITGDVSGGIHSTSVDKLKGQPVASTTPTSGQVLTWNGSTWAPATASTGGGGGANGLTYYLRQDVDADAPTTNLPGTPKQLGRTGATGQTSITSGTLTTGAWTLLGGYVSESLPVDPNITAIPGGLWDINLWAYGTANQQSPTLIRAKVYTYNGADAPTLLATSGEQIINTVSAQYSISVLVPQTTVQLTTRIYVAIEVQPSANNHTATLQFGDGTPSHVHTSLPLVGGSGLWRSISGVLQPNGTQVSDSDVATDAAIAQSKISGLTDALANVSAPGTYLEFFEHFMSTTSMAGNIAFAVTGGTNTIVNAGLGIIAMSTGATATANQQARLNQAANNAIAGSGAARAIFRFSQNTATWFDATLTGALRCGWGDSTTGESTNAIYFRSRDSQAIDFVTKTGNVETVTSTGVSFALNVFRNLEILINTAGSQVIAKIDGVTVATHTTNIPAGRLIFFTHINRVSTTGTAVAANLDFVYLRITPPTPFF